MATKKIILKQKTPQISSNPNLPNVPTKIPGTTAGITQGGNDLTGQAIGKAIDSLGNSSISANFQPNVPTQRLSNGDTEANRKAVEDAAYANLTQDYGKRQANDTNMLNQNLYNRGIALDPQDPNYARQQKAVTDSYNNLYSTARNTAISTADTQNAAEINANENQINSENTNSINSNNAQINNLKALQGVQTTNTNNAGTQGATNALKQKTPAEIAALTAQANNSNASANNLNNTVIQNPAIG